jgi:type IV secretion system protein VirB1
MEMLALLPVCAPLVHPETMLRVLHVESSGNPLAINVNGPAQLAWQPRTRAEAVATARELRRLGYDFDAGIAQINVRNWHWLGLDEVSVFDPCRNLAAAQSLLLDCFKRAPSPDPQTALRQALSCYNTGNHRGGFANGYVARVVGTSSAPPSIPSLKDQPS